MFFVAASSDGVGVVHFRQIADEVEELVPLEGRSKAAASASE